MFDFLPVATIVYAGEQTKRVREKGAGKNIVSKSESRPAWHFDSLCLFGCLFILNWVIYPLTEWLALDFHPRPQSVWFCVFVCVFYFCYKYFSPFKRLLHSSPFFLFALSTTIVCIYLICFAHHYFCSCSTIQLREHGSLPVCLCWCGLV